MKQLKDLKNLGPGIRKNLALIGVKTLKDLQKLGPTKIYKKLQKTYPDRTWPVCYYLYSLEGALVGLHWNDLPVKRKKELLISIGRSRDLLTEY